MPSRKPAKPESKLATLKKMVFGGAKAPAAKTKAPAKTALKAVPPKTVAKTAAKAAPAKAPMPAAVQAKPARASRAPRGQKGGKGANKKMKSTKTAPAASFTQVGSTLTVVTSGPINSSGETVCREIACEGLATTLGYCRLHYIKNWKKIKKKEEILKEGRLNRFIEELVSKYPEKYIEAIRHDLANDKEFAKVIYDLDLDESFEYFDEEAEGESEVIGPIKRDVEDEDASF